MSTARKWQPLTNAELEYLEKAFNNEKSLTNRAIQMAKQFNDCKHPGCCCVCGHQGLCPEDGPTAGLSDAITD